MRRLGLEASPTVHWGKPFVYGDVSKEKPFSFQSAARRRDIIGILALSSLTLPEVAGSEMKLEPGEVAYFRGESPVIYRSCGGGRGIMFYLEKK